MTRVAILIPCLNEEHTVARVVRDFRTQLPEADIFVFDNDSTDQTAAEAKQAGATVLTEKRRGKGFVVQSMFQRVQADIYVMVDGDDTYPAEAVHSLIEPIRQGLADMTVGSRFLTTESKFHLLNRLGNKLFLNLVNFIFKTRLTDVLSGFRAMNHNLVKGIPLFVTGFEIEIELTIKALERGFTIVEVPSVLRPRPQGSTSKIHIIKDGLRILGTILALLRDYKPLTLFGAVGSIFVIAGSIPGFMAIASYLRADAALHLPSAVLATGLVLAGILCTTAGLVLHTINRRFQELEYFLRLLRHQSTD